MGSVLDREKITLNDDGTSAINYSVPTLSIAGTRDGISRLSRTAESYWHQVKNVQSSQADTFPVEVIKGVSH
jgi:hypothetical protein